MIWKPHLLAFALVSGPAQLQAARLGDDYHANREIIDSPTPAAFSVCFNHSCHSVETHSISAQEWERATAPLQTPTGSGEEERHAIAVAIGIIEEIVGQRTGTHQDLGRNLRGLGRNGQMDCIDESTNSTTYLYMLEQAGYLRWHKLLDRSTRFGIFAGMPHTTAVIEDIGTGTRYAVDSWFFDNGIPPAIVELSAWKKGWGPGDSVE